jgi:hypothetical protein
VQGDLDIWVYLTPSEDDPTDMVVDVSKVDGLTPLVAPEPQAKLSFKKGLQVRDPF